MTLKELGQWEYHCLNRDLERQDDPPMELSFDEWYEEVFLIDEAWTEVRAVWRAEYE